VSHEYGDERIAEWLRNNQYHPRSPKHGRASCRYLLDDLLYESDAFSKAANAGEVVYQEDFTVGSGESKWNTDLVVGPPDCDTTSEHSNSIAEGAPAEVWLAIDAKSVMTEHGKARRNRQRDINSFADTMHRHYPGVVTGGVIMINMADRFRSPLRDEGDITKDDRIEQIVSETVDIFRDVERANGEISPNVDGVGCVVVDHTNIDDGSETRLVTEAPAPQQSEIIYYRTFVAVLADTLEARFLSGDTPDMTVLREADRISDRLRRESINLAHCVYQINRSLGGGGIEPSALDQMRDSLDDLEQLTAELDEFVDE